MNHKHTCKANLCGALYRMIWQCMSLKAVLNNDVFTEKLLFTMKLDANFKEKVWAVNHLQSKFYSGAFFLFQWPNEGWTNGLTSCWQHQYRTDILLKQWCEGKVGQLVTLKVTGLTGPHRESLMWGWLVGTGWEWGDHQASARARQIDLYTEKVTRSNFINTNHQNRLTDNARQDHQWHHIEITTLFCHYSAKYHSVTITIQ